MLTPDQIAAKWSERMGSGSTKQAYIQGVQGYQGNPMEAAAAADDLFLRKVEESVRSGRRAARLRATPRERWLGGATGKGADRLSSGASTARPKVLAHFQTWGPRYQQVRDAVRNMPKGTRADSEARMRAAMNMLMDFAGKS